MESTQILQQLSEPVSYTHLDVYKRQASDNASMDLLIKSMVRLLDRFVVCDLENDRYRFYNLQGEMIYAPTGTYHDFVEQVVAKYKTCLLYTSTSIRHRAE